MSENPIYCVAYITQILIVCLIRLKFSFLVALYLRLSEHALESEDLAQIAPGMNDQQARTTAEKIFSDDKIKQYGLVALEFEILT